MRKKHRLILMAALAAVILVLVAVRLSSRKSEWPGPVPPRPIPAAVLTVIPEEVPSQGVATGIVISAREATLASKVLRRVVAVPVREGDRIQSGRVLIKLDDEELRAQRAKTEADRENARAHWDRIRQLYEEKVVTQQERDNAERAWKVAEASHQAIEAELADTVIAAPFDGIVTEKLIEPGEVAAPGRPLLKIEDHRRLRLETDVPEAEVKGLHPGDPVRVALDALGDRETEGRIHQILPAADPATHSFRVKVDLPYTPGLKSGLFGRMFYPAGSQNLVLVPRAAVLEQEGLARVYVVGGEGLVQGRLVKLGRIHGEQVEVLAGLVGGERILERAQENLEGARITPMDPPS